jgi:hypothetical protein
VFLSLILLENRRSMRIFAQTIAIEWVSFEWICSLIMMIDSMFDRARWCARAPEDASAFFWRRRATPDVRLSVTRSLLDAVAAAAHLGRPHSQFSETARQEAGSHGRGAS